MANNLTIRLKSKLDRDGCKYHIGKLKGPFTIDCRDGIAFLIFTAEDGAEEIQVCADNGNKDDQ